MYSTDRDKSETPTGYIIDIVSSADADAWDSEQEPDDVTSERPWVGVHFECCGVYTRLYREAGARQYEGRCPRCCRPITIGVGPEGIRTRILRARLV